MSAPTWVRKSAPNAFNKDSAPGTTVHIVLSNTGEMVHSHFHPSNTKQKGPKYWVNNKPGTEAEAREAGVELKKIEDLVFNGKNAKTGDDTALWMRPSKKDPLYEKVLEAVLEAGDNFRIGGKLSVKLLTSVPDGLGNKRTWAVKYEAPTGAALVDQWSQETPAESAPAPTIPAQKAAPAAESFDEGWDDEDDE